MASASARELPLMGVCLLLLSKALLRRRSYPDEPPQASLSPQDEARDRAFLFQLSTTSLTFSTCCCQIRGTAHLLVGKWPSVLRCHDTPARPCASTAAAAVPRKTRAPPRSVQRSGVRRSKDCRVAGAARPLSRGWSAPARRRLRPSCAKCSHLMWTRGRATKLPSGFTTAVALATTRAEPPRAARAALTAQAPVVTADERPRQPTVGFLNARATISSAKRSAGRSVVQSKSRRSTTAFRRGCRNRRCSLRRGTSSGARASRAAPDGPRSPSPCLPTSLRLGMRLGAAKARGLLSISRGRPRATGNGWDLLREAAPR